MFQRKVLFGAAFAALLVAGLTHSQEARAAFSCGPYAATYRVTSNGGLSGAGVRCLVLGRGDFSWYGEGTWQIPGFNPLKYRHYGTGDFRGSNASAQAADIYGNGENATWRAFHLAMTLVGDPMRPSSVVVSGDWNETWTLESSGTHHGYTSQLGSLQHCGAHYTEYRQWDNNAQGSGVRCMMADQNGMFRGVGGGHHGGVRYLHLLHQNAHLGQGLATDICDPSQADFCNQVALSMRREGAEIVAEGWGERWFFEHGIATFTPNPRVVEYALRQLGTQVGNGECWTLAMEALGFASALQPGRDGRDVFNFGLDVTGQSLVAGDIVQLFNARIDYPDGSWSTFVPQHTAIIEWAIGKQLGVLHQNIGGDRRVQKGIIDLNHLSSGTYRIYRPLAR